MGTANREKKTGKTGHGASAPASASLNPDGVEAFTGRQALGILALGLLVAVSYVPVMLWGGFVWDDRVITDAGLLHKLSGLWRIWFSPNDLKVWEGHYWPLVYTTFWLEHKLWGVTPLGYHVVNVGLHFVNTVLLRRLLARLAVPGAWVVAAVFAVHPVHVESVAWVIERKDLLSTVFYLAACLTWVRFGAAPRVGSGRYLLTLALFVGGLLCKSIVVTLPAALVLWLWWKQGRVAGADWLRVVPFFAVGLGIVMADVTFSRLKENVVLDYSMGERVLIAGHALWFYAGKLVWPVGLAVIYPHWEVGVADLGAWGYVLGAGAVVGGLWGLRHRVGRGPLVGVVFFGVTLLPVLGFVDYGYMQFSFVADRYQYLAGIGVLGAGIGAAAYGLGHLRCGGMVRWVGVSVVLIVLVVLGTLTWQQAGIYRDNVTFYTHILSHNPTARSIQYNLGNALLDAQRTEEALAAFHVAVEQNPDSVDARSNTGRALMDLDRLDEAEERLRHALEMDPRHTVSLQNLALVRIRQQRHDEALDIYRRLIKIDPGSAGGHSGMGIALHYLGRTDEALQSIDLALSLDPTYAEALNNRELMPQVKAHADAGFVLMEEGRLDDAEKHLRYVLKIDPVYTVSIENLALLQLRRQRYGEARVLYQRLVALDADNAKAWSGMGIALFYLGRTDEALQSIDRALTLDPTLESARVNRAAMRESLQRSGQ